MGWCGSIALGGDRDEPLCPATDVHALAAALARWHPDIAIGGASCYLREAFYVDQVYFEGGPDRDVMVVVFVQGPDLVGMWSLEKETDSLTLYARLIVIDPGHRSAKLASNVMPIAESVGRAIGAAFLYAFAPVSTPHAAQGLERAGFRLLGFFPGRDREEVAPGVVKRVYQTVYAKLLVAEEQVHWPDTAKMTPRTRDMYSLLFPERAG